MKRILCIVGSMDVGGAETFLMKIYRALNKNEYQMDFCVAKKEKGFYEDEIRKKGGRIYRITPKTRNAWKNFNDIRKIVKNNQYKNVIRISQNSLSSLELLAARMGGAKKVAFRSSNSSVYGNKKEKFIHHLFRPFANLISNIKIAPSREAGKFMFGRSKFAIIKNGLCVDDYVFSEKDRKKYRNEFSASEKTFVIGHVGRFNKQKNHKFLIDVFEKYHNKNHDSVLWLFGEGELKDDIEEYIKAKKLEKNVKFMGVRKDIDRIYSAIDCFVFPSLFEGMPNAVIEAQAAGLPCVISDSITRDCNVTKDVKFLAFDNNLSEWAASIVKNSNSSRKMKAAQLKKVGYDIDSVKDNFLDAIFNVKHVTGHNAEYK